MFAAWFLWMAIYYGFRMFLLTPWYDELYTYYYFISRGPVYAAIHWPLPNNHVGYSVLSGFLNLFGSSVLGLRGVSYIAALANLILLYIIGRKCFSFGWSFCCVVLYSCMNLVNQLAVQGRGYTLAAACFLTAVHMIQKIGWNEKEETKKDIKYYALFSVSLTLGLYILPSSVYWVLPVCVAGGLFFLFYKKRKSFVRLVISSILAAWHTVFLYIILWLAIGSNLLSKAADGQFYGRGHIDIIRSAPFLAIRTGMDYMLATPYIQSVQREGYFLRLLGWLRLLFGLYYPRAGTFLLIVTGAALVFAILRGRKEYKEGGKERFFPLLFASVGLLLIPVFLTIQCALPYFRVFSYAGALVAALLCMAMQYIAEGCLRGREGRTASFVRQYAAAIVCTLLAIVLLLSKGYNSEYGMSEYYARDAFDKADILAGEKLCVTDCYQQYLLKFYYGVECENTNIEEADLVLLHKEMIVPRGEEEDGFRWEFYHTYDSIPWDVVENTLMPVYENEEYILYRKK